MSFDSDFVWGAASAAYQTEGAWQEDGKGPSIWDIFCHETGHIMNDETGDISCDSYHHLEEDVMLMKEVGLLAYRFSISWPRLFPAGDKVLNEEGLQFYDKMIDLLLENQITPYITLYHWDLPQALQEDGGWSNRKTADAFAYYAEFVANHFKTRVKHFITLNEPQIFIMLGLQSGVHAPGFRLSDKELFSCVHNALLAHGMAVKAMRETAPDLLIGISSTGKLCYPATDSLENIEAADKECFSFHDSSWLFTHTLFLDPVILGKYPENLSKEFDEFARNIPEDEMKIISMPLDFLGVNIYNGIPIGSDGKPVKKVDGFPRTALKWAVTEKVMRYGINSLYRRYHLPILITENGQACNDRIFLDGKVHDPDRIDFLQRYLSELEKAVNDGTKVLGYFHWSFLDNFEWHSGYDERFGLVYVDYETKERILKDSAYWFKNIIKRTE